MNLFSMVKFWWGGIILYLLTTAHSGINAGDIIFQLIMFFIFLAIPLVIIVVFLVLRKSNNRLKRVEEKLDILLSEKEKKIHRMLMC
jgi:energy-converting hydrogenase Eha subunit H